MDKLSVHLALAQTFLFAPGHRPEFFNKALSSSSKAVIIDLEDAVPPDQKAQARENLQVFFQDCSAENLERILIRINPMDGPFTVADLAFLNALKVPLHIVVPKAESITQLNTLCSEVPHVQWIVPIIESALGIDCVKEIATHPLTLRLALGNIDTQADLGLTCDAVETELLPVRFAMTLATRLAQIAPPIDGVTTDIANQDLLKTDTQRSKRLGFGAKLCIHPKQVDGIMDCFKPTPAEVEYARRVVAADQKSKGAAVKLDGKMIDRPVVLLAQRTLKLTGQS